jgi:hypothetical protein
MIHFIRSPGLRPRMTVRAVPGSSQGMTIHVQVMPEDDTLWSTPPIFCYLLKFIGIPRTHNSEKNASTKGKREKFY